MADSPRQARWAEIAADLADAIESNRYTIGSLLPSETDLADIYGVSRFTVREALRRLSEAGLITRRHGSGSRVVASSPRPSYVLALDSESDVLRYAAETSIRLTGHAKAVSAVAASALRLDDADSWIVITGLREAMGKAIGLVEVYLQRQHREVVDDLGTTVAGAIYQEIIGRYGLTLSRIEQTITATTLSAAQARRLKADAGEPALRIMRRYVTEEAGTTEVSVTIHPATRFTYSLNIDARSTTLPT